jgi:hypothetical protein
MISGFKAICRSTTPNACNNEGCSRSVNSIRSGTIEERIQCRRRRRLGSEYRDRKPRAGAGKPGDGGLAQRPINRPGAMARMNAIMVPSVVAIRNGGLFGSENGVFDMMPNGSAGSDA